MGEFAGITFNNRSSSGGDDAATPSDVGVYSGSVEVDFGPSGDFVSVEVTGLMWVKSTSKVMLSIAPNAEDHDPEDALLEQIVATAASLVADVGFTIYVHAPNGTWGRYLINWVGV